MRYKLVNFCEIDSFAVKSYCALHNVNEDLNLGDITTVDKRNIEDFDILVGGSPCTDFSTSGQKLGSVWTCKLCKHQYNPLEVRRVERNNCPMCHQDNLERTRSSLIVELSDIIALKRPKLFLYENVKTLVESGRYLTLYNKFLEEIKDLGYNTYNKILNAKDFGVPQQRERLFLVCIRQDVDTGLFKFPNGRDTGIRVKHILNKETTEKNYLSQDKADNFITTLKETPKHTYKDVIQGYHKYKNSPKRHQSNTVYWIEGLSPTVDTKGGGNSQPKFLEIVDGHPKIRKTLPNECWRLMGFTDEDFEKVKAVGISNQQLYKQAGNSIVVNVLEAIFKEIRLAIPDVLKDDIKLLSTFSGIGAFEKALDRLEIKDEVYKLSSDKSVRNIVVMQEKLELRVKALKDELEVDKILINELSKRYIDLIDESKNLGASNRKMSLKRQIELYFSQNITIDVIEDLTGSRRDYIYQVISKHKDKTEGLERKSKGDKTRDEIEMYMKKKLKPSVIADKLGISRQYVYRVIKNMKI